jgi:hypothetical protein
MACQIVFVALQLQNNSKKQVTMTTLESCKARSSYPKLCQLAPSNATRPTYLQGQQQKDRADKAIHHEFFIRLRCSLS